MTTHDIILRIATSEVARAHDPEDEFDAYMSVTLSPCWHLASVGYLTEADAAGLRADGHTLAEPCPRCVCDECGSQVHRGPCA